MHLPDEVLTDFVSLINSILDGSCTNDSKLGVTIPLLKDELFGGSRPAFPGALFIYLTQGKDLKWATAADCALISGTVPLSAYLAVGPAPAHNPPPVFHVSRDIWASPSKKEHPGFSGVLGRSSWFNTNGNGS